MAGVWPQHETFTIPINLTLGNSLVVRVILSVKSAHGCVMYILLCFVILDYQYQTNRLYFPYIVKNHLKRTILHVNAKHKEHNIQVFFFFCR